MERLIHIVTNDLLNERLKAEAELERLINDSTLSIDTKLLFIKEQLKQLIAHNEMASTWAVYTTKPPQETISNNNL